VGGAFPGDHEGVAVRDAGAPLLGGGC